MATFFEKVLPVSLEDEMKSSYIDYAMSVIVARALPDVRDGLKPVHRRVLVRYARTWIKHITKPYKKSARIVGEVLGKYHPHGDTAVYDSHGKNGSGIFTSLSFELTDKETSDQLMVTALRLCVILKRVGKNFRVKF
jgi:hypothetical protein